MVTETGGTSSTARKADFAQAFGSETAFRAWYDVASPRVFAYLYGRCGGDRSLAEELTQQTFFSAVRDRTRFDGRSDAMTWIITIARSRLVDHYRRLAREQRRHLRVVVNEVHRDAHDSDAPWQRADARESVLVALRSLPAEQRAALVLHHVDGLSVHEVAGQLGRSSSATESLLARARRRFRGLYEEADHG